MPEEECRLLPTPASEWPQKAEAEPTTLPSGAVAVLRQPNVYVLTRIGEVPAKVRKIGEEKGPFGKLEGDDLLTVLDFLVCASFVVPKCSFTRRKGVLWIGAVSEDDKAFIISHLGLKA